MEVIYIFDWLGDLIQGVGDAIGGAFGWVGDQVSSAIWEAMLQWVGSGYCQSVRDVRLVAFCGRSCCGNF